MKKILIIMALILLLTAFIGHAEAAKKKPLSGVGIVTQKIKGGKGLNVTFSNLQTVRSVSYILSYEANGQAQGVVGSISPGKKKSIKRQLLYGTCSAGVCRYHKNIKKTVLEVTSTLKNGRQTTRTYKIR